MRLILKLLLVLLIIFLVSIYLKPNYSSKISELDQALNDFIPCFGIKKDNLKTSLKQTIYKGKHKYLYIGKEYKVRKEFPLKQFEEHLQCFLRKRGFRFKKENYGSESENVRYEIFFKKYKVYALGLERKTLGKLALVIDDWGYSPNVIPYLRGVSIPLNVAMLPLLKYTQTISKIANENGHELLLHLPMQPLPKEKMEGFLEKITIKEDMEEDRIKDILLNFINGLSNIKGVNNHMGSLISRNEKIMSIILKILKESNLYYLDSKVIPDSVAPNIAQKIGIKCFQRDIFIDNKDSPDYIKNQIRQAINLSQKRGYAIAIGHAKKSTLEAIKDMVPEIIENSYPIKLSELK